MYALVYPGVLRLLPRCVSAFGLSAVCQLKWKNNRQVKDGTALGSLTPQFDPQYLNGHNRLDVPVRSGAQARMRVSSGAFDPPWHRHAPSCPVPAHWRRSLYEIRRGPFRTCPKLALALAGATPHLRVSQVLNDYENRLVAT